MFDADERTNEKNDDDWDAFSQIGLRIQNDGS
jgi:hypothetical protein